MIRLALTGSIGMGKSTTAAMFAEEGVPVWDADAAVHRLYRAGAPGAVAVAALAPTAMTEAGAVDRDALRAAIAGDPTLMGRLEAAIHPLVAADREAFAEREAAHGTRVALFDIPLLFETGGDEVFDKVIVASAPAAEQRRRVMARGRMSEADFERILARQVPDAQKRARADFVVETGEGMAAARDQVRAVLAAVKKGATHA
ncbi:MAG: dephospho-CoA kinase [Pseudomonadota bacterium]